MYESVINLIDFSSKILILYKIYTTIFILKCTKKYCPVIQYSYVDLLGIIYYKS